MKLTRNQLRKIISESIMPGKLPMPRRPGDRFPGDERPSPRQQTYGDHHPTFDDLLGSNDPLVKLGTDIFRTIMATDKKAIEAAIENGEDFSVPLTGSAFDAVKKALTPVANSSQVMLNEVHPGYVLGGFAIVGIIGLTYKALDAGYNVELEGNVSTDQGVGKSGPNRKDSAGGKIIFTKPSA